MQMDQKINASFSLIPKRQSLIDLQATNYTKKASFCIIDNNQCFYFQPLHLFLFINEKDLWLNEGDCIDFDQMNAIRRRKNFCYHKVSGN